MIKNKIKKRILREVSYLTNKYIISPEIVSLVITYTCNFKCQACSVWRMAEHPEITLAQWQQVSDQLSSNLSKETSIEISGGEPMIKKEEVLTLIKQLKKFFTNVGINSNGSLMDESAVMALKDAGITFVKISLYSFNNQIHDSMRGFAGAATHVKNTIEILKKHNIKTDIGILITSKNILDIPTLINFYNKPEYSKISLILQPLDEPIGLNPVIGKNKTETIENLWPDEESTNNFFSWLAKNKPTNIKNSPASIAAIWKYYLDQKSALTRRCLAGQRSLVIYPNGDISLCYKGNIIGNLTTKKLETILSCSKTSAQRKIIKTCQKSCRIIGCNFSKTFPEILGF